MGTTLDARSARPSSRKGRPNYAPEYRRQVAVAASEPGISVAKLAQAHGLNLNMVFKWRRQLRAGLFDEVAHSTAVLLPVALPEAPTDEQSAPASLALQPVEPHRESLQSASGIEIELNGARVRVTGMVDPVQLRLVLRCLMPA
ncbi:transposase [Caballeronia sp. TF1N1]|uniref:IS66-like element accessory protein TnpA n=1 Tax=Caballeronia sp. TF1N1 TaxID=2878153 RepID=UPI001FD5FE35|nr:transposase [Caballeronia sp. TF1N1]